MTTKKYLYQTSELHTKNNSLIEDVNTDTRELQELFKNKTNDALVIEIYIKITKIDKKYKETLLSLGTIDNLTIENIHKIFTKCGYDGDKMNNFLSRINDIGDIDKIKCHFTQENTEINSNLHYTHFDFIEEYERLILNGPTKEDDISKITKDTTFEKFSRGKILQIINEIGKKIGFSDEDFIKKCNILAKGKKINYLNESDVETKKITYVIELIRQYLKNKHYNITKGTGLNQTLINYYFILRNDVNEGDTIRKDDKNYLVSNIAQDGRYTVDCGNGKMYINASEFGLMTRIEAIGDISVNNSNSIEEQSTEEKKDFKEFLTEKGITSLYSYMFLKYDNLSGETSSGQLEFSDNRDAKVQIKAKISKYSSVNQTMKKNPFSIRFVSHFF